ncbi:uncharacterized protein LOC131937542 [Physella acuta]|uniref:uncharacterized protein LOC131937542 n=1 Tax=Physella acuta TaxID=109671 RepID=UPI0027DB4CB3|nr:uncharacterized protein LOC131937542 [Physella acuta]XP_059151043.1 uncharacterized protein LOC131937542 [Physella acuta]XP_059151044.1 uncharacterized protein LOC131937542 [Physella acuta]XP_059151045.1 uncharacterized protein LOC131937542 [Physella acuta]XP_059151046.1 uncharacterized protein LOC131937542 [Physella acuta]
MGKEGELLKAIKEKDNMKVQKLLSTTVKKKKDESLYWQTGKCDEKLIRVELRHIDVNTREPETLYTPLLLAVLHGSKEIAEKLILHCADVKARDVKGNTGLHLAVFHGRYDLVELLLLNGAEVNAENEDGNTALHISCQGQAVMDMRVKIIKTLIKKNAIVWTKNKYNLTPLDIAATFNRKDAITALLDYAPHLMDNHCAIVEASIRGFKDAVEILLDYGVNPNYLDDNYGSTALHEAVRFSRTEVVELLLAFQADPNFPNMKKETPRSLVAQLPSRVAERMVQIFEEQPSKVPRSPQKLERTTTPLTPQERESKWGHIKDYPVLPNDLTWTQNRPLFCSSCTEKNPNSHILDGNPRTFWVVPVLHDAWTVLDLHTDHMITGITVYGWNSPQMLKTFQLQTSNSLDGQWITVTSHTCDLLGSTDIREPAFPQKFSGFTFQSQYIRLYLVDNHGGSYICFQGIELHGVDCKIRDTLQDCGLHKMEDDFICKGLNTWKRFLDVTQETVDELVSDPGKKAALWEAVYRGRRAMYKMTMLTWLTAPAATVFDGENLPDFCVQSDPGVTEVLELVVQNAQVSGNRCKRLIPNGEGKPAVAVFSEISITPAGMYYLMVKGVTTEITLLSPRPTEVRPKFRSEKDISSAFDEIQQMISEVQATLPSHC